MKSFVKSLSVLLFASFVFSSAAFANKAKTLIEMNSGKPTAGLAKSWKKLKDGEYEFTLDTAAELTGGKALTAGAVKSSLESKLASSHGVKVTPKGSDKVTVVYTSDEAKFLDQMSKTRIRAQSTEIALESSSEGGIRARKAGDVLKNGEVKGFVMKVAKDHVQVKIIESKHKDLKADTVIKVKSSAEGIKKNNNVYFAPEKKTGEMWSTVGNKIEKED